MKRTATSISMTEFYRRHQQAIVTVTIFIIAMIGMIFTRAYAFIPGILGFVFVLGLHKPVRDIFPIKLSACIGGILFVAFISSFFAPDPTFSMERVGKVALILIPSLLFVAVCRSQNMWSFRNIMVMLLIGHVVLSCFLYFERVTDHVISDFIMGRDVPQHFFNRSFVVFSLWSLTLSFLLLRHKKYWLLGLTILFSLTALSVAESQTGQLSFIVGLGVLFLLPVSYQWITRSILVFILLFSFSFPFVVSTVKKHVPEEILLDGILREASIVHRLEVWQHSAQKTFEKPIFGHGIEALRFLKSNEWMVHQRADSILHSHNAALQIWVEFGLVGMIFAALFLSYIFWRLEKVDNIWARKLYFTILLTSLCISFTGYGLWQSWQLGLFIFFAGLSTFITREDRLAHHS